MFDSTTFIDNWASSYNWQDALSSGETTVAEILADLHALVATGEGFQPEPDEWNAIERELKRYTR